MTPPLVSVLLPYFNAEKTLEDSALSILQQTYPHLELILVDNNSSDSSAAIAQRLSARDSRVVLMHEVQQGVVHATDAAFAVSRGCFIARMDADDYAYPRKLAAQVAFLQQNPSIGAVSCLVEYAGAEDLRGGGMAHYVSWTNTCIASEAIALERFVESPIINPTMVLRREVAEQYGLYRSGDFPEDYELWLRLLQQGVQIGKVPEVLLRWQDSQGRLTRTDSIYSSDSFYRIKSQYAAQHIQRNIDSKRRILVWGAGRVSRKRAQMLAREGIAIDGFIDFKENASSCVMDYRRLRYSADIYILVYVASWGARTMIRTHLLALGFVEGRDFLCMA